MKFRVKPETVQRLELAPEMAEMVFDGPTMSNGVLAGFTVGEIRWMCKVLGVRSSFDIDPLEMRIAYFMLSIRRARPGVADWMPSSTFVDLSDIDFVIERHVPVGDPDEGCYDCGRAFGKASLHITDGTTD